LREFGPSLRVAEGHGLCSSTSKCHADGQEENARSYANHHGSISSIESQLYLGVTVDSRKVSTTARGGPRGRFLQSSVSLVESWGPASICASGAEPRIDVALVLVGRIRSKQESAGASRE